MNLLITPSKKCKSDFNCIIIAVFICSDDSAEQIDIKKKYTKKDPAAIKPIQDDDGGLDTEEARELDNLWA